MSAAESIYSELDPHNISSIIAERRHYSKHLEVLFQAAFEASKSRLEAEHPTIDWSQLLALLHSPQSDAWHAKFFDNETPASTELQAFAHIYNVRESIQMYIPVILDRIEGQEQTFKTLGKAITHMHHYGFTYEQACKFFNELKIAAAFTSHPTESLSENGIRLCRELVSAAEITDTDERDTAITQVISDMLLAPNFDFGAKRKASILDEIDASNEQARIHNKGVNTLERFIAEQMHAVYDVRPSISLDISPRTWDYDSDGKNNAEGWAFLAKMASTTMGMFEDLCTGLKTVLDDSPLNAPSRESIQNLANRLETVRSSLAPVYEKSRAVLLELATAEDTSTRAKLYANHYPSFTDTIKAFGKIYDAFDKHTRGFDFFKETIDTLNDLRHHVRTTSEASADTLDEMFRTLRRNGFVLERGQTRQNDIIHKLIINNLFNYEPFKHSEFIEEIDVLDAKMVGGISFLPPERQFEIFTSVIAYAEKHEAHQALQNYLYEANPLTIDPEGNGYPDQERTLLDRFALRALYPLKFDQGIISDCGQFGPMRQMFLSESFGMFEMKHMPLHEDLSTLSRQGQLAVIFKRLGGAYLTDKIKARLTGAQDNEKKSKWAWWMRSRQVHSIMVMRACSDSEKSGGLGTRLQGDEQIREIARNAYLNKLMVEVKIGGGFSLGRFGGDVSIVRRLIEQELKCLAVKRGKALSREVKEERRIMEAALTISYTVQGRAKRIYEATPAQVTKRYGEYITEMIHGRFDLEGLVDNFRYISPPDILPSSVFHIPETAPKHMIRAYNNFRFATTSKAEAYAGKPDVLLLNRIARKTTCPNLIGFANNGARPGSKGKSKEQTEVRAIENNQRDFLSGMHANGYFGMGQFLHHLHDLVMAGQASHDDILQMITHQGIDYNLFQKALIDAGRADFTHALKALDWEDADFESLMSLGQSVHITKDDACPYSVLHFNTHYGSGRYTAEHAYIAKIYYERAVLIGLTEALLRKAYIGTGSFTHNFDATMSEILSALKPTKHAYNFDLGAATQAHYPGVVYTLENHQRVTPMQELVYSAHDYIAQRLKSGENKNDVLQELGGESALRQLMASWRAGTAPHDLFWAGDITQTEQSN